MIRLIMMTGIPASGKTELSLELEKTYNAVVLSSDKLRKELFGDENYQLESERVFRELHIRAKKLLLDGKSVIYDATNIISRRRWAFLREISGKRYRHVWKECVYIPTSLEKALEQNNQRDRKVPEDVIKRMYKSMQVPTYGEGWDDIRIIGDRELPDYKKIDFAKEIIKNDSWNPIYNRIFRLKDFMETIGYDQETPHHTLSLNRHIWLTTKIVQSFMPEKNINRLLISALFHDLGKVKADKSLGDKKYYGHEYISSQMAVDILMRYSELDEYEILKIAELVQLHMKLPYEEDAEYEIKTKKFKKRHGRHVFKNLEILRLADISAK